MRIFIVVDTHRNQPIYWGVPMPGMKPTWVRDIRTAIRYTQSEGLDIIKMIGAGKLEEVASC